IKAKYFKVVGDRKWVFSAPRLDEPGEYFRLLSASRIRVDKHVKIVATANCYLPEDEQYFERLKMQRLKKSMQGYLKLWRIAERQNFTCPVCCQQFNSEDEWDIHHIIRRVDGGSDKVSNLLMLHLNCHR
ncbi:HNH endonuclease, partial [Vibrio campbellii]